MSNELQQKIREPFIGMSPSKTVGLLTLATIVVFVADGTVSQLFGSSGLFSEGTRHLGLMITGSSFVISIIISNAVDKIKKLKKHKKIKKNN